jgi:hypothetical protein
MRCLTWIRPSGPTYQGSGKGQLMVESRTTSRSEAESYIRRTFAENAQIPEDDLFADDMTLAAVISRSPRMTNSIDLMEAFARTSNSLRKDFGLRVRLPALPLDTSTSTVLTVFLEQLDRQGQGAA